MRCLWMFVIAVCFFFASKAEMAEEQEYVWWNSDLSYLFISESFKKAVVIFGIKPDKDRWVALTRSFSSAPLTSLIIYSLAAE